MGLRKSMNNKRRAAYALIDNKVKLQLHEHDQCNSVWVYPYGLGVWKGIKVLGMRGHTKVECMEMLLSHGNISMLYTGLFSVLLVGLNQ